MNGNEQAFVVRNTRTEAQGEGLGRRALAGCGECAPALHVSFGPVDALNPGLGYQIRVERNGTGTHPMTGLALDYLGCVELALLHSREPIRFDQLPIEARERLLAENHLAREVERLTSRLSAALVALAAEQELIAEMEGMTDADEVAAYWRHEAPSGGHRSPGAAVVYEARQRIAKRKEG